MVASQQTDVSPPSQILIAPKRKKRKLGSNSLLTNASDVPVLSPARYLSLALKNKGIKDRIGPLTVEQAMFFEPYREAQMPNDLLRAVRKNDVDELKGFKMEELKQRNEFGESLLHLVCRHGFKDCIEYLLKEANLPLNVRDKFGRSPLHIACLSHKPNFDNIILILKEEPKLVVFEDDKGKLPFDYISTKDYGRWSRFLSEERILTFLQSKLDKQQRSYDGTPPLPRIPVRGISLP